MKKIIKFSFCSFFIFASFFQLEATPVITSITRNYQSLPPANAQGAIPTASPANQRVYININGSGFEEGSEAHIDSTDLFGKNYTFSPTSANSSTTEYVLHTPEGIDSGIYDIYMVSNGETSNKVSYNFFDVPKVTQFFPDQSIPSAYNGLLIFGSNFIEVTNVTYNGLSVPYHVDVNGNLTMGPTQFLPDSNAPVEVYTTAGSDSKKTNVSVGSPLYSSVTNINPSVGTTAGGTQVSIVGDNYDNNGQSGEFLVYFGDNLSPNFSGAVFHGSISATTPPGNGTVPVRFLTASGFTPDDLTQNFTYVDDSNLAPTITSVTPQIGIANSNSFVTLNGTNFRQVLQVYFGEEQVKFKIISDNQIIAYIPSSTDLAKTYDISVTNAFGQSEKNKNLRFTSIQSYLLRKK